MKISRHFTQGGLPKSVFLNSSSFLFAMSLSSSSLALENDTTWTLQYEEDLPLVRKMLWIFRSSLYLCISKASEFCSSWMVVWICSSFSACWFLTLLSSSKFKSLLWINSVNSSLLCSSIAATASRFFWRKENILIKADRSTEQFYWKWQESQHTPQFLYIAALLSAVFEEGTPAQFLSFWEVHIVHL